MARGRSKWTGMIGAFKRKTCRGQPRVATIASTPSDKSWASCMEQAGTRGSSLNTVAGSFPHLTLSWEDLLQHQGLAGPAHRFAG